MPNTPLPEHNQIQLRTSVKKVRASEYLGFRGNLEDTAGYFVNPPCDYPVRWVKRSDTHQHIKAHVS